MSNEGKDEEGKVIEPQISYWMHDPRSLHRDILVTVHENCHKSVKKIFPNFDNPTSDDWDNPLFPTIDGDIVEMKNLKEFMKLKRL